jgi:hypothetical protein
MMITHETPVLVVPPNPTSTTLPLVFKFDQGGVLVTPQNLALDVLKGGWKNGGVVVLSKRVAAVKTSAEDHGSATAVGAVNPKWAFTDSGSVVSDVGKYGLVEDMGRAVIWEDVEEMEDQRWELVQVPGPVVGAGFGGPPHGGKILLP